MAHAYYVKYSEILFCLKCILFYSISIPCVKQMNIPSNIQKNIS